MVMNKQMVEMEKWTFIPGTGASFQILFFFILILVVAGRITNRHRKKELKEMVGYLIRSRIIKKLIMRERGSR